MKPTAIIVTSVLSEQTNRDWGYSTKAPLHSDYNPLTSQSVQTLGVALMASQERVAKYTEQNCGKPIECTESHQHYRSEMVPGITTQVSYIPTNKFIDYKFLEYLKVIVFVETYWECFCGLAARVQFHTHKCYNMGLQYIVALYLVQSM